MKILNLYCGIGGNRNLWSGEHEVTAVEIDSEIAAVYQELFPNDKVIVTDAHQYLLEHYKEFDFIWSSPPCPSHSRARYWSSKGGPLLPIYPEMQLWQEIIFLKSFSNCKYAIENVISYYPKILNPKNIGNHYIWSNFNISNFKDSSRKTDKIKTNTTHYGYNIKNSNLKNKIKILRNLVNPKIGLHVFNCAFKEKQQTLLK